MRIIDISMEIKENMVFFPNDPEFKLKRVLKLPIDKVNLSKVVMGVHTGTHIDAPLHFIDNAPDVTSIPLTKFYGPCSVLDLTKINFGDGITDKHLSQFAINTDDIILFKTKNSKKDYREFRTNFVYLTMKGANYLIKRKVKAVGIDYLSISKYDDESQVHQVLLDNEIVIVEGLNLLDVEPGPYIFSGFPLKIADCEGAPTRAVLIRR
ncbi:MAG: cyclase family protein [Candidatus Hodarchaeales archaeon]|jgi:arylformamidase